MKTIAIIPARMGSSRFPGKPMAKICGIPMIEHVWKRAKRSSLLDEVYVATCDQEIYQHIVALGGKSIMTSSHHERCTERTAEALLAIEKMNGQKAKVVVMIQGDEPLLMTSMIEQALGPFRNPSSNVQTVNLMGNIRSEAEYNDPNSIKVVTDVNDNAIYFSRSPIPSTSKYTGRIFPKKQICIIPFERDFLLKFIELGPTPLEIIESVDMLRIIEHGYKVKMVSTECEVYSVDTPEDLCRVEKIMQQDSIFEEYRA